MSIMNAAVWATSEEGLAIAGAVKWMHRSNLPFCSEISLSHRDSPALCERRVEIKPPLPEDGEPTTSDFSGNKSMADGESQRTTVTPKLFTEAAVVQGVASALMDPHTQLQQHARFIPFD